MKETETKEGLIKFLNERYQDELAQIVIPKETLFYFIKKLDKPETLSQKWISEKSIDTHVDTVNGEIQVTFILDDLKDLLVPKQEELETKTQELIEVYKQEDGAYSNPENGWIGGFIEDLKNLLEKEQKYVIKLDDESYLQRYEIDNKNIVTPFRIVGHLKEVAIKFDNKERAEKVAKLVEGKVEELEE